MKMKTSRTTHSMNRSPVRLALPLIPLALSWFALSPQARGTCQEGCDTTTAATFLGEDALVNNNGTSNTGIGSSALTSNTGGSANTATGSAALLSNTGGSDNTATGVFALRGNTTGNFNTATGQNALLENTIGGDNTAIGYNALDANTTGNFNTAIGAGALGGNTIGSNNTAIGISAGNHITRDNNICIGNGGFATDSNTIRIGTEGSHTATYIAGIRETPLVHGTAVAVGITADGQLGVRASSMRFKEAINPMDKASEAILSLHPVTFRYRKELDPDGIPQFGLVAEEVEKVNPDLVARDDHGKPYTVRYEAVNAMLLNEFLKEHRKGQEQDRKIEEQGSMIAQQQKQIETLTAMVKKQAAQIQKVNTELQLSRPALQTVVGNR
jgi:hypothetical protein